VVAIHQIGLYLMDMYDDLRVQSYFVLVQQTCMMLGVAFLAQALAGYAESSSLQLPQWTMLYGSFFVLLAIPTWHSTFLSLIRKALPSTQVLFVGMSPCIVEVIRLFNDRTDIGYTAVGYLGAATAFTGAPHLGSPSDLATLLPKQKIDILIVDQAQEDAAWLTGSTLLALRAANTKVEKIAPFYEMVFGRVSLHTLQPSEMLFGEESGLRQLTLRVQSLYSFVLACFGFLVCSPIMLLVFVAVRLTSPGPALYKQRRSGKNGVPFYVYKFRSMYIDAEARSGPVWATKNDPRVTPLGRWLRKLRLDELPQFFNVIRGDMALVGPRPERPEFCEVLEQKIPFYNQRLLVKPGVTGWAQINHKYTETIEDTAVKLEYDLYYVKRLAPALDFYIIFHTIKVMLLSRGAQ
jgi:exopolysaccharide biosynthesis polyprenyl glycosylphosphotransferase